MIPSPRLYDRYEIYRRSLIFRDFRISHDIVCIFQRSEGFVVVFVFFIFIFIVPMYKRKTCQL